MYLPKVIKIDGNLTKANSFAQFFLRHGVVK